MIQKVLLGAALALAHFGSAFAADQLPSEFRGEWCKIDLHAGRALRSIESFERRFTDSHGSNCPDADSINFTRIDLNINKFFPMGDKATLAFRAIGGLKLGEIESSELYYVGGANTVRGYDDTKPFGTGTKQGIFNVEYRHPFNDVFTVVLFYDTGFATLDLLPFDFAKFHSGRGVGVRLNTPLGPIRLDYGIADDGSAIPHFSIGNTF